MRLLFDENLSARLVTAVADVYPGPAHVVEAGLGGAPDEQVWEHAGARGFVLVTKDEGFHRLGNCATADVARLLRVRAEQIARFVEHEDAAFLALR